MLLIYLYPQRILSSSKRVLSLCRSSLSRKYGCVKMDGFREPVGMMKVPNKIFQLLSSDSDACKKQ